MKFKNGVKINGIKPECVIALMVCDAVYESFGQPMIVTSVMDGEHKVGSLHDVGFAFDLRTRVFHSSDIDRVKNELVDALTDEFDVVIEDDHIHIEFQPKGK